MVNSASLCVCIWVVLKLLGTRNVHCLKQRSDSSLKILVKFSSQTETRSGHEIEAVVDAPHGGVEIPAQPKDQPSADRARPHNFQPLAPPAYSQLHDQPEEQRGRF